MNFYNLKYFIISIVLAWSQVFDKLNIVKDLFILDKNRGALFRKYIIYVDVIFGDDGFEPSQKLSSFFGQVGVYEGNDKIINYFNWFFETNEIFYFLFEKQKNLEEKFFDENVYDDFDNVYNLLDDNWEEDNKYTFYAPLSMLFYYGEKKVDFLLLNCFKKNYYFKNQAILNCLNYLKFKENENYNFYKCFHFNLIKKYDIFFSSFNKIFKNNNNFYSLLNKGSIDFFKNDNFLFSYYKQLLNFFNSKESKIFIFKKILLKKNFNITHNLKKIKWFDSFYLLNLFTYKNFLSKNNFKHSSIFDSNFCFVSQLNSIKKKFLKRFKRKKRYKKVIVRDFFGKKNIYEKVYNIVEEKKKKRRK